METTIQRFIGLLTSFGLLVSMVPVYAAPFTDVDSSDPHFKAIDALQGAGVVEGYDDGTFKSSAHINRAEFLKIVLESRDDISFAGEDCFPDVNDEWFAAYVCTAKKENIVGGYPDGTFKPEQNITFVEAAKILSLAYDQPIEQFSPDWYEPYARALESSKAIPLEIERLDALLTRGEMAEMMWRLDEGVTNRPSKGYMNVKYPEMKVNLASDSPQRATSCTDLRAFREEAARTGATADYYFRGMAEGDAVAAPQSGAKTANSATNDYSKTNVQVEGVDEGDIVKTDGTHLYIVSGNVVRIVLAQPANGMEEVSVINDDENTNFTPTDLYVDGDRLVVLGHSWEQGGYHIMDKRIADPMIWPGPWYNTQKAEVRIYDISNKASPKIDRKVSFDGNTVSSRRIEDRIYLVVNQPGYWGGPIPLNVRETDVLPSFQDSARGDEKIAVAPCDSVTILPRVPTPQYLTVGVVPIRNKNQDIAREVILGNAENIYASLENLYIASTEWNYVWNDRGGESDEKTNVYRFAFTDDGVSMAAQGTVPGRILNQFSMDEHESTFRIATTRGSSWDTNRLSSNNLYVLNRQMQRTGAIEDIAPGEQIYSVRFVGDRTYMVTFKNIDPLFVIDTSDPRNPTILGKLKIPGYSTYLHPYDENHIIGFGKDAVDAKDPNFAWYQGMKIALFDVSDVENPKELHKVTIGDRGTDSPLLYNHKALLFDKERNLLAFPISVAEIPESEKTGNDGSAYGSTIFQGAYIYDLTLKDGFKQRGSITHYEEDDFKKAGEYLYSYGKDVERIARIGESLLTISQGKIESHDEDSIRELGSLTLSSQDDIRY